MVRASDGGTLAQLGLKTRLAGIALSASRTRLRRLQQRILQCRPATRCALRDELRADGLLRPGSATCLPLSLQLRRDVLASGAAQRDVAGRVCRPTATAPPSAMRCAGNHWSAPASADGVLQASRRVAGIGITGQLHYTLRAAGAGSAARRWRPTAYSPTAIC